MNGKPEDVFNPKEWICVNKVTITNLMNNGASSNGIIYFAKRCRERTLDPTKAYELTRFELQLLKDNHRNWIDWLIKKGYILKDRAFKTGDIIRRENRKTDNGIKDLDYLILRTHNQITDDASLHISLRGHYECYDITAKCTTFMPYKLLSNGTKIGTMSELLEIAKNKQACTFQDDCDYKYRY